ncbi:hypothetical protein SPLC1_S131340 [Arthrospira platensis C1]|uniref:Uncharacterized protein n=1 Tax=Limnospira maxima CS-328 TaxID=513049 RepID=B5W6F2_LIMMA|nr:hypothetical protein AmaxDRAFT_4351 [Limnospira maxima CS-328]EKD09897.1 hypothetical protein SPLC1_S131340 [Arthrospira platensis C1]
MKNGDKTEDDIGANLFTKWGRGDVGWESAVGDRFEG